MDRDENGMPCVTWSDRLEEMLGEHGCGLEYEIQEEADGVMSASELDPSDVFDAVSLGMRLYEEASKAGKKVFAARNTEDDESPLLFFIASSEDEVVERIRPLFEEELRKEREAEEARKTFPEGGTFNAMCDAVGLRALEADLERSRERRFKGLHGQAVVDRVVVNADSRGNRTARIEYASKPPKGRRSHGLSGKPARTDGEALRSLFERILREGLPSE